MVYPVVKPNAWHVGRAWESRKPRAKRYRDMYTRALPAAAVLALTLWVPANAQPSSRCTREVLNVQGTPLTASICVTQAGPAAGHELPVSVDETYSTPHGSVSRTATLRFIAGEPSSRVLEDVELGRLGLSGTLHLTLLLHAGSVRVDAAMLTPGAVTIK